MTDNDVKEILAAANTLNKFIQSNVDDLTEHFWYLDSSEVFWNTENNEKELVNQDGNTYSLGLYGAPVETENYIIFEDCFDGCGGRVTAVFNKAKKFDIDKYWDEEEE